MNKKIPELILSELAQSAQKLSKELNEQLVKLSNGKNHPSVKACDYDKGTKFRSGW